VTGPRKKVKVCKLVRPTKSYSARFYPYGDDVDISVQRGPNAGAS